MLKLDESNVKIERNDLGYRLKIIMPDGSDNYLHSEHYLNDINFILKIRDNLINEETRENIEIIESDGYYRIVYTRHFESNEFIEFHSRKLNLNDVIYERMQLLISNT